MLSRVGSQLRRMMSTAAAGAASPREWVGVLESWLATAPEATSDAAHDISHVRRVARVALDLAAGADEENAVDETVVVAAAYLHDIVNVPKNDPRRKQASTLSAARAAEVLRGLSFPEERLPGVQHAIAAHSFSAGIPCETPEARVLQDADRMDAVGAIGAMRCFYVSGHLDRPCYDPADPLAERRSLDDSAFALDHFPIKLFTLEATMTTPQGRAMAADRTAFLTAFRAALVAELRAGQAEQRPAPGHARTEARGPYTRLAHLCCAAGAAQTPLFHRDDPFARHGRELDPDAYVLDAFRTEHPDFVEFYDQLEAELAGAGERVGAA